MSRQSSHTKPGILSALGDRELEVTLRDYELLAARKHVAACATCSAEVAALRDVLTPPPDMSTPEQRQASLDRTLSAVRRELRRQLLPLPPRRGDPHVGTGFWRRNLRRIASG